MTGSLSLWPPSFDAAIFDFDGTLGADSSLTRLPLRRSRRLALRLAHAGA